MEDTEQTKKGEQKASEITPAKPHIGRPHYRHLSSNERDLLFSYYEKWNGNMLAMVRDHDCILKSYAQIRHYCVTYKFEALLIKNRLKRAKRITDALSDSKMIAVEQARKMIQSQLVPLTDKDGKAVLDGDKKPIFIEVLPSHKAVKAGWEILKTELGEATTVGKVDHTTKGEKIESVSYVVPLENKQPEETHDNPG